jgi:hypothetical protein
MEGFSSNQFSWKKRTLFVVFRDCYSVSESRGGEVYPRIRRLRPHQRVNHRQERRNLHDRPGVDRKSSPRLAKGNPHRKSHRRQSDDVHPAPHDAEFSGRRHGRRHRHRRRRQPLFRGSEPERRDEIRQEVAVRPYLGQVDWRCATGRAPRLPVFY